MRKFLYLLPLIGVFLTVWFVYNNYQVLPAYYYSKILKNGAKNSLLNLDVSSREYFVPIISKSKRNIFDLQEDSYWRLFEFTDFKIPLPIEHPEILIIPYIQKQNWNQRPIMGIKFFKHNRKKEIIFFKNLKNVTFKINLYDQKFLLLPLVRKEIQQKTVKQIWKDLYSKNLLMEIPYELLQDPVVWAKKAIQVKSTDLSEYCYNLYLLYLRQLYFKNKMNKITWNESGKFGIIDLTKKWDGYYHEIIQFLRKNEVFSIELKTKKGDKLSAYYRELLLKTILFNESNKAVSSMIYKKYKNITYNQRIDQVGFIYLFAAWSHVYWDKHFLREMIQFLERGKNNKIHLLPLYDYAYKMHGTNFSKIDGVRKETSAVLLKRKIKEEDDKELRNREIEGDFEDNQEKIFENVDSKIMYYLKKAKKKKKVIRDDILIID